jgi:UDP-N-acetyl-D-galactosamine dehydrogenase
LNVVNELPNDQFEAIILAVAHNEFKKLDIEILKKDINTVVYDVKGFLNNHTHKL